MRLTLTLAALQILLSCRDGADAFGFRPQNGAPRPALTTPRASSTTALNVIRVQPKAVDPSDPYYSVLSAYQKKAPDVIDMSAPTLPTPEEITAAVPVPDVVPDVGAAAAATSDAGPDAVNAVSDAAAKAISDVTAAVDVVDFDSLSKTTAQAASDAAAQAAAAAEKAAAAAADIAAPSAAMTAKAIADAKAATAATAAKASAAKASAAAASAARATEVTSAGKALTLSEYMKAKSAGALPDDASSASAVGENAKAKFGLILENIMGPDGSSQITAGFGDISKKLGEVDIGASVAGMKGAMDTISAGGGGGEAVAVPSDVTLSPAVETLLQNLHIQEYGAWYAAGAAVLLAAGQRDAGKKSAEVAFEGELSDARAKADEAAEAAAEAAAGAMLAKELAEKVEAGAAAAAAAPLKTSKQVLEESKIKAIEVEKEMMAAEIIKLNSETALLRRMLNEVMQAQLEAQASGSSAVSDGAPYFAEPDVIPEVFERMEHDPEENKRILAVIKELDDANNVKKAAAAPKEAKEPKKAAKGAKAKAESAVPARKKSAVPKRKSPKRSKVAKKKKELTIVEASAAVEENPAEEKPAAPKKAKAAKKAKTAKKAKKAADPEPAPEPEPAVVVAAGGVENPWNTLSDSTLKRKTIKQLTNYLLERQISVTDNAGKVLKKADLVSAVRGL